MNPSKPSITIPAAPLPASPSGVAEGSAPAGSAAPPVLPSPGAPQQGEGAASFRPEDQVQSLVSGGGESVNLDNPPDYIKALDAMLEQTGRESWDDVKVDVSTLPLEVQKRLHDLYRLANKGRRETTERERKLEEQAREVQAQRDALEAERAQLYSMWDNPVLREIVESVGGDEKPPDRWQVGDDAWSAWHARKAAKAEVVDLIQKLSNVSDESRKAAEAAAQRAQEARDLADLQAWIASDAPDFEEPAIFTEIERLVNEHNFDPRSAYRHVKDRQIADRLIHDRATDDELRAAIEEARARSIGRQRIASTGPAAPARAPEGLSPGDLAEWYERNPEALARRMKEIEGGFDPYIG